MPTKIAWCNETINPQGWGCYGPGGTKDCPKVCSYCYAKKFADRGLSKCDLCNQFIPHWHPERLEQPCKWKKPRSIFWQDMGDLLHDETPAWQIRAVLSSAIATPRHTHLFLTKNPKRYLEFTALLKLIENCFCGVTVTNQDDADRLIPVLLKLADLGIKVFLSIEPMLGPVDLGNYIFCPCIHEDDLNLHCNNCADRNQPIHQVILGGETGSKATPMHPEGPRGVRDQCKAANVPFMFKGWGEWTDRDTLGRGPRKGEQWGTLDKNGNWFPETTPWNGKTGKDSDAGEVVMIRVGRKASGRLLDGVEHDELVWREGR